MRKRIEKEEQEEQEEEEEDKRLFGRVKEEGSLLRSRLFSCTLISLLHPLLLASHPLISSALTRDICAHSDHRRTRAIHPIRSEAHETHIILCIRLQAFYGVLQNIFELFHLGELCLAVLCEGKAVDHVLER